MQGQHRPLISLIIPMYNEQKVIAQTLKTVQTYFDSNYPGSYEILVVDDGSVDASREIVRQMQTDRLRLIDSGRNYGKGHAIRVGVIQSRGEYVMFTDSDLAYGLDVCARGLDILTSTGADMVIGSRQLDKSSFGQYTLLRKIASNAFLLAVKVVGGLKQSDSQCGCKLYKGSSAKKIFTQCEVNGWSFDFEALLIARYMNMDIREMPVKIITHGESKIRLVSDGLKMLGEIIAIRKRVNKKFKSKP